MKFFSNYCKVKPEKERETKKALIGNKAGEDNEQRERATEKNALNGKNPGTKKSQTLTQNSSITKIQLTQNKLKNPLSHHMTHYPPLKLLFTG